ncbi:unnamed protein product [Camellia sinensis]|uniref:uncharacterized protein LOC114264535 isoform X1 n=1 Tax=Camellia sinensis TaxID=4442 RepID=UPI001036D7CA|nr:uncharacterized protein LOC114264535 isoform X1 [Camellia sinensis]XP_028060975.1 uncharacterized protein LOC114264535 isoform X3 [Camellia sinensis]XP_028060977.1 uncharacterized protein LOC114264535 isoform X1 [Camellia sinensis]XP_028060978.1 uncharacterized protein LOC114264535 isoform X1 [Camellia sinensis]
MVRFFRGGGKSSSASSGSKITRKVAAILSLSALSKNLENFPGTAELYPCDNVDKEYEECNSTTPTSYDAKHCEKIRKMKASCLERAQRWEQHQEEYKESLQKKATAAGFDRPIDYLWHEREKDPQYCRISYEMYKKCLSENEKEKETMCEFMRNNCPQFK